MLFSNVLSWCYGLIFFTESASLPHHCFNPSLTGTYFTHWNNFLPIILVCMSFWHKKQNSLPSLNQSKSKFKSKLDFNFTKVQKENFVLLLLDWTIYLGCYRNIKHALDTRAAWKIVYVAVFLFDHSTQNQQWNPAKEIWNFILFRNIPF